MAPRPRPTRLLAAATLALLLFGVGSCGKNLPTGQGIGSEILVQRAGPLGAPPGDPTRPWDWAVNSIDSVVFVDEIDSTRLEATSFRLVDANFITIPGTVRFMPDSAYIRYTQAFPSAAYDFVVKSPRLRSTLKKVYFIPDQPLHGHTAYGYLMSTAIRMERGQLRRDGVLFQFVTGDSIAPGPSPQFAKH